MINNVQTLTSPMYIPNYTSAAYDVKRYSTMSLAAILNRNSMDGVATYYSTPDIEDGSELQTPESAETHNMTDKIVELLDFLMSILDKSISVDTVEENVENKGVIGSIFDAPVDYVPAIDLDYSPLSDLLDNYPSDFLYGNDDDDKHPI